VDFDHTITTKCLACKDGYKDNQAQEGAREVLTALNKDYQIWIFTGNYNYLDPDAKLQKTVAGIENFLKNHKIPFDRILQIKPPACFIIDDRAIHHTSWKNTLEEIRRRCKEEKEIMAEWIFPEKLPTFKPEKQILKKVFHDSVALAAYAQYKRKHIVEKNENLWLPHFALLFSKVVKDLRAAGTLSFTVAFEVWWQLWRMNPMYLTMGYHAQRENFEDMVAAIMPYINGQKKLEFVEDEGEFFVLTKETTL